MRDATLAPLQRGLLGLIALAAMAALVHRLLFFQTPLPAPVDWNRLQVPGFVLERVAERPAVADRQFARGQSVAMAGRALDAGPPRFQLDVEVVHSRESETFDVEKMTQDPERLKLQGAHTQRGESARLSQWRVGTMAGRSAAQTCLVRRSAAAVETDTLVRLQDAQRTRGPWETARQIAGLRDNIRWECALVTVTSLQADAGPDAAEHILALVLDPIQRVYDSSH